MEVAGRVLEMLCDQSLSDAARVIGLRIAALGDDWHEIAPDDFSKMVAGYPTRETVARHLRQLEMAGYAERKPGGRGHSDLFRPLFSTASEPGSKKDSPVFSTGCNDLHASPMSPLNAPTVSKTDSETDSKRARLSKDGERAIEQHGAVLTGCRGTLRDYLAMRVQPEKQSAYVQSLVCSFQDMPPTFRKPDGSSLAAELRTAAVAAALNELMQSGEQRDIKPPGKPMKWPDGDIRNLRTKIEIHLKQSDRNGSGNGRRHNRATGTEGPGHSDQSGRRRNDFPDEG